MLRARKHRFALCFRVLSNQYVDRSAYANVFKFSRENELFERGKLNSTGFRPPWSPSDGLQHGVSILNTFSDTFCRIARVRNIAHPRNLGTLFIYYSSTIFNLTRKSEIAYHLAMNLAGIVYECGMLRYSQFSHGYKRQKW